MDKQTEQPKNKNERERGGELLDLIVVLAAKFYLRRERREEKEAEEKDDDYDQGTGYKDDNQKYRETKKTQGKKKTRHES